MDIATFKFDHIFQGKVFLSSYYVVLITTVSKSNPDCVNKKSINKY